jgi:folate-dependent phosphoribosylglycinamide formyltransferase PurN
MTLRLAWFATARGQTSGKLLSAAMEAVGSGRLDARIVVVFCNRERGEDANTDAFLDLVESLGLPLVMRSSRDFRRRTKGEVARKGAPVPGWRREYDREVMRLLQPYDVDYGVLAGYMLIFCEEASSHWQLLNLHPAAPGGPAGMWQDVIWQLIAARAEQAGVMVHLATPELDEGPVVAYCLYSLRGGAIDALWRELEGYEIEKIKAAEGEHLPLFKEIRRRGVAREMPLVIETLVALAEGRVRVEAGRVTNSQGQEIGGLDLTAEIEQSAAESVGNEQGG